MSALSGIEGHTEFISDGMVFHGNIPYVMGTRLDVIIVGLPEMRAAPLWERLHGLVFSLDRMLNRFSPESEVYGINQSGMVHDGKMSPELKEITGLAREYNERTLGLFDVRRQDGMLDFGGFGKGYFLRRCRNIMKEEGVECAYVDFGGSSILGMGHHPYGDSWKVGVICPYTHVQLDEISLYDKAMSTSGNSPSYSGHIIHPVTGKPNYDRKLVSVVSPDPLDAEVLSTATMIASDDEISRINDKFADSIVKTYNLLM